MQELQDIVNAKLKSMNQEGVIQNYIEEGVQASVKKAINSEFESYGSITKQIEKAIKEGLELNVKDLSFESYNQQMLVAVKQKLGDFFKSEASTKFMEEIDKTLTPAPADISISELAEKVVSYWKSEEPWDDDDVDECATVEISEKSWSTTSHNFKMWKKVESSYSSSRNQPDLELFISDGKLMISHKQSYNPTCFSEHEAFIFKLYAAGTKITGIEDFDPDECDLTLKESEY